MLPSAYWLLSLFKPFSKYNTAPFRQKKALYLTCFSKMTRNVHVLCSCRKQSLPYCWLQIIYNWANNSLNSKGFETFLQTGLHASLALISKQANLLTTIALNTGQFNVNGIDPYMEMAYLHLGWLQLCLFMPLQSVWSTDWVVRVNAIESYSDAFSLQQNLLRS